MAEESLEKLRSRLTDDKSRLAQVMPVTWWHQAITRTNVKFSFVRFCGIHLQAISERPDSILRCHLTSVGNPIVEIRRSYDRLISTMWFPILIRQHLYIESGTRISFCTMTLNIIISKSLLYFPGANELSWRRSKYACQINSTLPRQPWSSSSPSPRWAPLWRGPVPPPYWSTP